MNYQELNINSLEEFVSYGKSLGNLVKSRANGKFIDYLKPSKNLLKDSLSKRYGLQKFPIHTDGAYFEVPPRYILLRYIGTAKKPTPTIIKELNLDLLSTRELDFLRRAIWYVKGIDNRFYTSILNDKLFRYDPEVMRLISNRENIMNDIIDKMHSIEINWSKNKVLQINNWKVAHYRPKVDTLEQETRIIQRINIL